ncbi:MAG: hypothetical protein AAF602_20735 [Myxococcota bacterium]
MSRAWMVLLLVGGCHWHNRPFPEPPTAGEAKRSNLAIPAGQTFELGGSQPGGFAVRLTNLGPTEVDVIGADGEVRRVSQGETAEATFAAGEMARLRNRSTQRGARLKVVYTQTTEGFLGMRYVDDAPE